MSNAELMVETLALQSNDVGAIAAILRSRAAFERHVEHLHSNKLVVERLKTFTPVPFNPPSASIQMSDDDVHWSKIDDPRHNLSSAPFTFVSPMQFDLAGQKQRPQLVTYLIA